jgi:hypothetical protein
MPGLEMDLVTTLPAADYGVTADADREDSCVGADGNVISDVCGQPFGRRFRRMPFAEEVIDEHDPMTDEAIGTDGDQFAEEGM